MIKDITGNIYGDFKVNKIAWRNNSRHIVWECICKNCGNKIYATSYDLKNSRKNTTCTCKAKEKLRNKINSVTPIKDEDFIEPISVSKGQEKEVFTISLKPIVTEKNNEENVKDFSDKVYCSKNLKLIYEKKNLLTVPVYYSIAHCIPADLSFYGVVAQKINQYYNMERKLKKEYSDCDIGDALWMDNVFNLILTKKSKEKATLNIMEKCIENLADFCYTYDVNYLAIPRLGSGKFGLNWEEVEKIIINKFEQIYNNSLKTMEIKICYI